MKERNDKKAWATYEKEGQELIKETARRREIVSEKYKNNERQLGMGMTPELKEAAEVTKWFSEGLKKLREKHGIK